MWCIASWRTTWMCCRRWRVSYPSYPTSRRWGGTPWGNWMTFSRVRPRLMGWWRRSINYSGWSGWNKMMLEGRLWNQPINSSSPFERIGTWWSRIRNWAVSPTMIWLTLWDCAPDSNPSISRYPWSIFVYHDNQVQPDRGHLLLQWSGWSTCTQEDEVESTVIRII